MVSILRKSLILRGADSAFASGINVRISIRLVDFLIRKLRVTPSARLKPTLWSISIQHLAFKFLQGRLNERIIVEAVFNNGGGR